MRASTLALVLLLAPSAAVAQSCPAPLASATRLVLVTADTVNSPAARVQRFTRANVNAPWRADGGPVSALVGRNGMAWGYPFRSLTRPGEPVKVEGDKRAPIGFYTIGPSFGFAASLHPRYIQIQPDSVCVDDPAHGAYNTITTRPRIGVRVRAENMARVPEYRRGLLVDYPSSGPARGGSCVFIHLWLPGRTAGTGGCGALQEPALAGVQDFAQAGAVLAILPRPALARFKGCLPGL